MPYSSRAFRDSAITASGAAGAGLRAAFEGVIFGRDLKRKARESEQRERLAQLELEQAEAQAAAQRAAPEALRGLAAAARATVPGPDVVVEPGGPMPGIPDLEAPAVTAPGPAQPAFADQSALLADPANAANVDTLRRAGYTNPMQAATGYATVEDARAARERDARKTQGQAMIDTALADLEKARGDDAIFDAAMRLYRGRTLTGELGDLGSVLKMVSSRDQKLRFGRDAKKYAKLLRSVLDPNVDEQTRIDALVQALEDPESDYLRTFLPEDITKLMGLLGPDTRPVQEFALWKGSDPEWERGDTVEAWLYWREQVNPRAALLAETTGKLPTEVATYFAAEKAEAEAKAREKGRWAGIPREYRGLIGAGGRRLPGLAKNASLTQVTSYIRALQARLRDINNFRVDPRPDDDPGKLAEIREINERLTEAYQLADALAGTAGITSGGAGTGAGAAAPRRGLAGAVRGQPDPAAAPAAGVDPGDAPDALVPFDNPEDEKEFQAWYAGWARDLGLDPNPDAPEHQYDWRSAYVAGAEPDDEGHWPSAFKLKGHPNRVIDGIDTRTGQPEPGASPAAGPGPASRTLEHRGPIDLPFPLDPRTTPSQLLKEEIKAILRELGKLPSELTPEERQAIEAEARANIGR